MGESKRSQRHRGRGNMWNRITACAVLAVCLALKADAFATMGHSLSSFSHASVGQRTLSLRRTFQAREVLNSRPSNGGRVKMVMSVEDIVGAQGILLAEEIFAQVAGGGIMIIFSGVIGALAVGALVNVDDLEEQYRKDNPQAQELTIAAMTQKLKDEGMVRDLPEDIEKELQGEGGEKE